MCGGKVAHSFENQLLLQHLLSWFLGAEIYIVPGQMMLTQQVSLLPPRKHSLSDVISGWVKIIRFCSPCKNFKQMSQ